jgi:restriction system protein
MARSFSSAMLRAARASNRAARQAASYQAAQVRAMERQARQEQRQAMLDYVARRQADVEDKNEHLGEILSDLGSILSTGLHRDPRFPMETLYRTASPEDLPAELAAKAEPDRKHFDPPPLGFIASLWPGAKAKYAEAVLAATGRFEAALAEWQGLNTRREEAMTALRATVEAHNRDIDALILELDAGQPEAIKAYSEFVLINSPYPEGFQHDLRVGPDLRVGLVPESRQLVVDLRAPTIANLIPVVEQYRYVKAQDAVVPKAKSEKVRQSLYASVIAQLALRTIHELFAAADIREHIETVVLNVYVVATDPGTGKTVKPYIVSTRVSRQDFNELELASVEPVACLKRLKAFVSRSPSELVPVKPIVDINMADPRFIEEQDILSSLDTRPNLMELSPGEFESLITNLFQAMGLDTKLTQASRDGGVDCVAFDPRPILGGKVVVQAKRYKNTVGVSAVRDLFGTMHNEGASKGILVTTSGFGKATFEFANEKPIELIAGSNLLYLLKEHAGVDAKIEMPADWVDPVMDAGR